MHDCSDDEMLLRLGLEALRRSGVDPDRVLARLGAPPAALLSGRFTHRAQTAFWQAAVECSGEEHLGLFLVPQLPPFHGLLLEYLFLSSATFGQGLEYALRYARLLSDTLEASLQVKGGQALLLLSGSSQSPRHFTELLVGGLIRLFVALTEGQFQPRQVTFVHARGAPAADYLRIYGCPVRLGADCSALRFDAEVLTRRSPHAAPQLLRLHETLARKQLAEVEKQDLVRQVQQLIGELVVQGVSLEQVAKRLQLPPRHLRERLALAGVRFKDLLDDYRCRLAKRLLLDSDERIAVIVERTGFSEPSTFYRAFRRWAGETPVAFRNRARASPS